MESLWQKESDNAALYVDIFQQIDKVDKNSEMFFNILNERYKLLCLERNEKNNQKSTNLRCQGNTEFGNKKWNEAMEFYNKSLSLTKNVSLAFANRSACFFHMSKYDKCLKDIELAKQFNCPERVLTKLDKRREDCLKEMENGRVEGIVPKLDFEENENYPGMADVLKIEHSQRFGRHVVAKRDIGVGKAVLIEETFWYRDLTYDEPMEFCLCVTCKKTSMNFIACERCTSVMFCSDSCLTNNSSHQSMCGNEVAYKLGLPVIVEAIKMFSSAKQLMEFVEDTLRDGQPVPKQTKDALSKLRAFLQLNVCLPKLQRQNICLVLTNFSYDYLLKIDSVKCMFETKQEKRFLMHFIAHCVCVDASNGFKRGEDEKLLFVLASYFNHSCAPNVVGIDVDNKRMWLTVRPIKKGQQLFISYLEGQEYEDTDARQRYISDVFGFICHCEKCDFRIATTPSPSILKPDLVELYHQLLEREKLDPSFKKDVLNLKKKCIKILSKSGDMTWNKELEDVSMIFKFATDNFLN